MTPSRHRNTKTKRNTLQKLPPLKFRGSEAARLKTAEVFEGLRASPQTRTGSRNLWRGTRPHASSSAPGEGELEASFDSLGEMSGAMWLPHADLHLSSKAPPPHPPGTFGLDAINTRAQEMVRRGGRGRGGVLYNLPPGLTRGQKLSCAALMATSSSRLASSSFHSRRVSLRSCQSSAGGLLFPRSLAIMFRMCRLLTVYPRKNHLTTLSKHLDSLTGITVHNLPPQPAILPPRLTLQPSPPPILSLLVRGAASKPFEICLTFSFSFFPLFFIEWRASVTADVRPQVPRAQARTQ